MSINSWRYGGLFLSSAGVFVQQTPNHRPRLVFTESDASVKFRSTQVNQLRVYVAALESGLEVARNL